jgi:hypothetical protein
MMEAATARPQEMIALDRANEVRLARANIKTQLRDGISPVRYIMQPTEELKGAKVSEILRACKGLGRVKTSAVLRDVPMSEHWTFEQMTERQKAVLIRRLRETAMGESW